jgi:hypothetical protein
MTGSRSSFAVETSKRGEDSEASEASVSQLGSVELFEEWVRTAVAPPSLQEEMLARIVRYGPDDLQALVARFVGRIRGLLSRSRH